MEGIKNQRPSKAEIDALKKKHGSLKSIVVNGKELIIRVPKMYDLEVALASIKDKNAKPYDFERSIVANCKIWAEDGMLEDDATMLGVVSNIDGIVKIAKAEIKEL